MSLNPSPTVLIVDDEAKWVDLIELHLENEHILTISETNPSCVLSNYHLNNPDFDCIISDHNMPSISGSQLLDKVRDKNEDIPFIFHTSRRKREIETPHINDINTFHVDKSFNSDSPFNELISKIDTAID